MSPKACFVTIGATAPFSSLIQAVLQHDFLDALEKQGYTDLLLQYGTDGQDLFDSHLTAAKNSESGSVLNITGFTIDKAGLAKYMQQAKGGNGTGRQEGVVVSHAGMFHVYTSHCILTHTDCRIPTRLWYHPRCTPDTSPIDRGPE